MPLLATPLGVTAHAWITCLSLLRAGSGGGSFTMHLTQSITESFPEARAARYPVPVLQLALQRQDSTGHDQ